jgi:hypothetical protein
LPAANLGELIFPERALKSDCGNTDTGIAIRRRIAMRTYIYRVGERRLVLKVTAGGRLVRDATMEEVLRVFPIRPEETLLTILRHDPAHLGRWIGGELEPA